MAPKTMRAVLIKDGKGPSSSLYLGEAPVPTLAPGQVLVRVHAFGLNRMDILQREGNYPVPPHASKILGVEFSGLIEEIAESPQGDDGDDSALRDALKKWKTGDPVYGLAYGGAYAEYIAVQATHILPKPEHLTFVQAASIPETWLTAYQALVFLVHLKKDEHVLIHAAASGVGIAAIQIARLLGASTVSATASSKSKLDFVQHTLPLGATQGINYKEEDFAPAVQKHTGGHGADVVIDFVGQSHWAGNIESLAQDGRMVILAFMSGTVVDKVDLAPILRKRLQIIGSTLRARSVAYQAELIRGFNKDVGGKITGEEGEGEVRTYIHKVFKWEQIKEAHDEMEGNATSGKIIVEVS